MEEVPNDADLDSMTIWVGPDLHFVQYCIRPGELFNQVAVFRSYKYEPDSDDWGTPEELDEHFGKTCPRVRHGIAKLRRGRRWPMFDRLPISNWTRNRITLLGDAAHPMLQYIAQGACQALEDAIVSETRWQHTPATWRGRFAAIRKPGYPGRRESRRRPDSSET